MGRIKTKIKEMPEQDGVLDTPGRDHLFGHVHEAVEAIRTTTADEE